ncbi:MAG: hypothetical protein WCK77_05405 [Verrucomicrobiota bacterium]
MKLPPAATLATALAIGVVGFLVGRVSTPGAADAAANGDSPSIPTRSSSRAADETGRSSATTKRSARPDGGRNATATAEERLKRLESIMRGENALERNRALLAYIDQIAPGDFEAAIAKFRGLGITESRFSEYAMLLTAWSQHDPTAALAYAQANSRSGFAATTILSSWAATDPEAAIRWAQANHTGTDANPYLAGIIRTLGATDPARASGLLTGMPRSQERGEALDAMLPHLLAQGADATRAWISALTDDSLRNGSMMRAADQMAKTDPKGTADWLLANPGEATNRSLDRVLGTWAASDEKAAVAYFEALPRGDSRGDAFRGVISAVAANNAAAAATMIDSHAADVTDSTLQTFVWHSFGSDPALALNYVGRIADPGNQERMYSRTLDTWLNDDPAAAQAWMQKNALPEKVARQFQDRAAGAKP